MKLPQICFPIVVTAFLALSEGFKAHTQGTSVQVNSTTKGITPPTPISVSGYPSDVMSVLDLHLTVCGFKIVPANQAEYELKGRAGGNLEGSLVGKGQTFFARAFSGGTRSSQAHALADEVTKSLGGQKPLSGSRLAFRQQLGSRNKYNEFISEIFVSDFDGSDAVQLTQDGTINASPNWIPGLRGLLYMSNRSGNSDIYSHDLATGARAAIARYSGSNLSPAVSPDGRRVAMVLSKGGNPHLWVTNIDGSGALQLTKGTTDASSPCWSPDGRTICFASASGARPTLYTIPASGGAMKKLKTGGLSNLTEPDWSPDGTSIAFTQMAGRDNFKVLVVDAVGGDAVEIGEGEDPCWAPNSRTLAINVRENHKRRLRLLDVPTRQSKNLPLNAGSCSQPSWGR